VFARTVAASASKCSGVDKNQKYIIPIAEQTSLMAKINNMGKQAFFFHNGLPLSNHIMRIPFKIDPNCRKALIRQTVYARAARNSIFALQITYWTRSILDNFNIKKTGKQNERTENNFCVGNPKQKSASRPKTALSNDGPVLGHDSRPWLLLVLTDRRSFSHIRRKEENKSDLVSFSFLAFNNCQPFRVLILILPSSCDIKTHYQ
jgi:hypothetical protein